MPEFSDVMTHHVGGVYGVPRPERSMVLHRKGDGWCCLVIDIFIFEKERSRYREGYLSVQYCDTFPDGGGQF